MAAFRPVPATFKRSRSWNTFERTVLNLSSTVLEARVFIERFEFSAVI